MELMINLYAVAIGTRLRYYIKTCRCESCNQSKEKIESEGRGNQYDDYNSKWWLQPLEHLPELPPSHLLHLDSKEVDNTIFTWISVDLSLLSRWPFIEQLSQCMAYLYMKVLLPDTIIYESKSSVSTKSASPWNGYPPFVLNYDQLIMALCFECPAPVPGLYSISMNIWGQASSTPSNLNTLSSVLSGISSMKLRQSVPSFKVDFHLPPTKSLPCCPYPITKLFEIMTPRLIIDVLCCALSESRILFHSNDLSKLPIICECVATLIYPLKWSHVYLPVVPASLLDLVEAPVPFILGTHSAWLQHLPSDCLADVAVIDCDLGCIDVRNSSPLSFPDDIDRWLMLALKLLARDVLSEDPSIAGKLSCQQASLYIQIVIFDVMVALLKDVPQCLFYLDRNTPIFNRPLFLSEFTSPASQKCVKILSDTNAFHRFTDALHTYRMEFFVESSDRFPLVDWMDEVEINPLLTINTNIDSPTVSDSSSATSATASILDVSSPISVSSPSYHEQYFGESTSLPPLPAAATTKSRGHIPFFSSVKQLITPKAKHTEHIAQKTPNSHESTPTRQGHHSHSAFPIAPTPMHKIFHSSFRAKDVEELIASSEAANQGNGLNEDNSAALPPPPLPRVLSRRFSFSKQKSANSASFRIAASRGSSDRGIDADIDNIFSDLTLSSDLPQSDSRRSSRRYDALTGAGIAVDSSLEAHDTTNLDDESDETLPDWLYYGKKFRAVDSKSQQLLVEVSELLKHRLELYLPHIQYLHKQEHLDPVLFIDIYDPSFIDEGLSSIASITRKRSSTFFAGDHVTPLSTASHDSGRISVRLPKKFFNESAGTAVDLGLVTSTAAADADQQISDDSSHSSRMRSATNIQFGSSIDVLKKRLVLQRSSLVVGVGVNIAHSADKDKDEHRRQKTPLSARDRDRESNTARYVLTSDSMEQMNTSTDATATGLSTHTPTEGSIEYPTQSNHSIESEDVIAYLDKGSGSHHSSSLHLQVDIMKSALENPPFAPVIFEHNRLSEVMNMINVWTLSDLAAATGEAIDQLAIKYADTVEKDLCVSDFSIMYKNAAATKAPSGRVESSSKRRRNTISNRFVGSKQSSTQLSHWLDQSPAHRSCAASILDYLKIVFSGLDVPEYELNVIRQACYDDLKLLVNRGSLLEILKQSHSNNSKDAGGQVAQNNNSTDFPSFFPLHSEAFASMTELFQEILSICTQQHDYLHAYDLLIAGGLYFDIGDESIMHSLESRSDGYVDFLNSSIKHHPIYQKPELWIAVLKLRLEANASPEDQSQSVFSMDHQLNGKPQLPMPLHPNRIHQVILETHAMLYMMHSLGVNPERAMLFVQNVVDLYDLDWKYFMELKLFLDRLWPSHRRRSLVTIGQKMSSNDDRSYRNSDELNDQPIDEDQEDRAKPSQKSADSGSASEEVPATKPKRSWFRWSSSSKKV
jgi:hypothetical protein